MANRGWTGNPKVAALQRQLVRLEYAKMSRGFTTIVLLALLPQAGLPGYIRALISNPPCVIQSVPSDHSETSEDSEETEGKQRLLAAPPEVADLRSTQLGDEKRAVQSLAFPKKPLELTGLNTSVTDTARVHCGTYVFQDASAKKATLLRWQCPSLTIHGPPRF